MGETLGCITREEDGAASNDVQLDKLRFPPNKEQMPSLHLSPGSPVTSARMDGSSSSRRWTATACAEALEKSRLALGRLRDGNVKYLSGSLMALPQDPDAKPMAIVACCSPPLVPLEVMFGVSPGEIDCVASASLDNALVDDGAAAALEFSMAAHNEVALIVVMETLTLNHDALEYLRSWSDAKATVWAVMERLLRHSEAIRSGLKRGAIYLHGAVLELGTGQVHFLGEHAEKAKHMVSPRAGVPRPIDTHVDATVRPPVPPEEALAMLQCGNLRAHSKAVVPFRNMHMSPRGDRSNEEQQNPFAVVFMSFDPHRGEGPLIEVIFDTHPSQIASIPTKAAAVAAAAAAAAGNSKNHATGNSAEGTEESYEQCWEGYVHLTEYCLVERSARLLLVLGRAPADVSEHELRAVKESVFKDMLELLKSSKRIKAGVADGQLQIQGAIYHGGTEMPPGIVNWLGVHPDQTNVLKRIATSTASGPLTAQDLPQEQIVANTRATQEALEALQVGNGRYLANGARPPDHWTPERLSNWARHGASPRVLVLAGANGPVRAPENLFHTDLGYLVVHRTCGALSGRRQGCALGFLDRLAQKYPDLVLILILGDVLDPCVSTAISQVQITSNTIRHQNAQVAMDQLAPATVHALRQTMAAASQSSSMCAQQKALRDMTTEFHVVYAMDRLLLDSDVVFGLVRAGRLQVQGAVVEEDGSVRFRGGHSDIPRVVEQRDRIEKHSRKGFRLGPKRHGGETTPRRGTPRGGNTPR